MPSGLEMGTGHLADGPQGHIVWLLEMCVTSPCPLEWLLPSPNWEALNREYATPLSTDDTRTILEAAHTRGLVRFRRPAERTAGSIVPVEWPIEAPNRVDVALTERGSAAWEIAADPEWDRLISTEISQGQHAVRCLNRSLLEEWLEYDPLWRGYEIVHPSLEWEVETPWQATYWKALPSCHVARFQARTSSPLFPFPRWLVEWRWRSREWFKSRCGGPSAEEFIARMNL